MDLFQVFMILVIVMFLSKFFDRIEHDFGTKSLGELKYAGRQSWQGH